ncbi:uncharacterized protein LOC111120732 [Crassostrea virginica]
MKTFWSIFSALAFVSSVFAAFGSNGDRILLRDIQTLTLKSNMMTNARRSSAVPQLKCIGGTAGCNAFRPQVVQCYNRGSDGYDVQWECKTDMDNAYRFGSVEVTCEGYDYPDDPNVLKGSCGLEYTIDLTKEGYQQQNQGGGHDYYGGQTHSSPYGKTHNYGYGQKIGSIFSDLFTLGFVALLVYVVYKTCVAAQTGYATNDEYRPTGSGYQPPPPGFRDEYTQRGCGPTPTYSTGTGAGTGGGFWSGAFTGGILGYMLGNNRNNYYAPGYTSPYSTGWGYNTPRASRGWFSSGSGLGSGFGGGSTSTGTRTISNLCEMKSCKNPPILDCARLNSTVSGRCCVHVTEKESDWSPEIVTGIDLIDCSLTNISGLFHSMEQLAFLFLHKNNILDIDVDDFTGVNELKNLTLPANLSCPGGQSLWDKEITHSDRVECLDEKSTCKVFNVTCPNSNSYCSDVGPRVTECLCSPGYHGYKCLRKDHFPTVTFVVGICVSTVVVSAFLWITQRRKVKKH